MNESSPSPMPEHGRLLGIDYGKKRLGVAVSDDVQTLATPVENYTRRDPAQDGRRIQSWIRDYSAVGIVLGLPVHMSGDESKKSSEVRVFGELLTKGTGLPVAYFDERFTSKLADQLMEARELTAKQEESRRDMLAAQIMLQKFLDTPDRNASPDDLREG